MSAEKIRCFIAIHLTSEVQKLIADYILKLKNYSGDVRWVRADNIHLTLKFLGEISSSKVEEVKQSLYPLSGQFSPFNLTISGSGCFPGKKRPRVFWLGMEQGKENPLIAIHQWLENQLQKLNFEKEERRFSPHLTLGRVKARQPVDFSELFTFLERDPFVPILFPVQYIYFMQSNLKSGGVEYHIIERYPL